MLKYVEDLRRGLNEDIARNDFFEMASNGRDNRVKLQYLVVKSERDSPMLNSWLP